jgi:hypothetical protein
MLIVYIIERNRREIDLIFNRQKKNYRDQFYIDKSWKDLNYTISDKKKIGLDRIELHAVI